MDFSFVSGAQYRPFSYQEMLQPMQAYTQEYNALEEGMGMLSSQADLVKESINPQIDTKANSLYSAYVNEMNNQVSSMSKNGLNPNSRQSLINLRKKYNSEIVPIEQAVATRRARSDEQRQAKASDNTLLIQRGADTISLNEYMDNPNLIPKTYSGALLSKQVASAAANLSKDMRQDPDKWRSILGGQYFEKIKRSGYNSKEILDAITNSPNAPQALKQIVEDVISSSGIKEWDDPNILQEAYSYANQGLWHAIGTEQEKQLQNAGYGREGKTEGTRPLTFREHSYIETKEAKNLQADKQFIKDYESGKVDLNSKNKVPYPVGGSITGGGHTMVGQGSYPNRDKLAELFTKYDANDIKTLKANMDRAERKSAVLNSTYISDITNPKLMVKNITENMLEHKRDTDSFGVFELKDGKKGSEIDSDEIKDVFNENSSFLYSPKLQTFVVNSISPKGKLKTYAINPSIINSRTVLNESTGYEENRLQSWMGNLNQAIDEDKEKDIVYYLSSIMDTFHDSFNNIPKIQSSTGK